METSLLKEESTEPDAFIDLLRDRHTGQSHWILAPCRRGDFATGPVVQYRPTGASLFIQCKTGVESPEELLRHVQSDARRAKDEHVVQAVK